MGAPDGLLIETVTDQLPPADSREEFLLAALGFAVLLGDEPQDD